MNFELDNADLDDIERKAQAADQDEWRWRPDEHDVLEGVHDGQVVLFPAHGVIADAPEIIASVANRDHIARSSPLVALALVKLARKLGTCAHCNERPGACFGHYEGGEEDPVVACDSCCGHGNEDGWCVQLEDLPGWATSVSATCADLREERDRMRESIRAALDAKPVGVAWPELGALRKLLEDAP